MSLLLAGLPVTVPGSTVNRLCGSGLDAIGIVSRGIRAGELGLAIAGGVESMSRAPYVMGKAATPFARDQVIEDTTMGWRFINPELKRLYGVELMGETAENVAERYGVSREDQDALALRSQQRAAAAQVAGFFDDEIVPVTVSGKKRGETIEVARDEHPRADTTLEALAKLKPIFRQPGTVTAGNASGINDGAAALLLASGEQVQALGLTPRARVLGFASAGVEPGYMGIGPVPATRKLLARLGLKIEDFDAIELNEAFAAQGLACLRELGVADDATHVNANGGAIALGHPLGASGARIALTLLRQLEASGGKRGLATMCIGVGQGVALAIERV
jgi:3-oxoadipyl-CoA thiolase